MTRLHSTYVDDGIYRLLEDLATPVSLKVSILYRYGEWDQLASLRVDPSHYASSESYWADAQAVALLKKNRDLPTSFDKGARAFDLFLQCERQCFRSNLRLAPYVGPGLTEDTDTGVFSYFMKARKTISKILGPVPSLDDLDGRFGPGATYGDKGADITILHKMTSRPTITLDSLCFLPLWAKTLWARALSEDHGTIVPTKGNRFAHVPKDAEKDRCIAIEPSINVYYQLLVGRLIRERLRAVKIDLDRGQDIHRIFACEASVKGHLATVDLSNASDTVCFNLVRLLLPPAWFDILCKLRSPMTQLESGKWVYLEKFSSMGNGFTFELESLVFLALIWSIDPSLIPGKDLLVYGDDIILPTRLERDVLAVFSFCGLELNTRKSFFSGPFRESCGGDYFNGVDVRPHYLKEFPHEPQEIIAFCNGLRRSCKGFFWRWFQVRRAWTRFVYSIPVDIRSCRGPSDLGDCVLHDSAERWSVRVQNSRRYFRTYSPVSYRRVRWTRFRNSVVFAAGIYMLRLPREGLIPRDGVRKYGFTEVEFS